MLRAARCFEPRKSGNWMPSDVILPLLILGAIIWVGVRYDAFDGIAVAFIAAVVAATVLLPIMPQDAPQAGGGPRWMEDR
jgi:hypothetical protein